MFFSSKLPQLGTTIFTAMSDLAQKHGAINLSQGFPDYNCDEQLIELVATAMREGHNQYAPMQGLMVLREAIAEKIEALYHTIIHPEREITITPGGTYAIYTALATVIHLGDEVIVLEPAYDSYVPSILVHGGVPVLVPLKFPDYKIDWELVQSKMTPRTKMIMINQPHNPTGSVITETDIRILEELLKDKAIFLLSDEVYEHLVYDGRMHQSALRYPSLREKCFAVFSFGKTYHNTGWKVGYAVAPAHLTKEFRKIHQYLCFSVNTPIQYGLAAFLQNRDAYASLPAFFQQKRDLFLQLMKASRFTPLPCAGSYFQLMQYDRISDEPDLDFAIRLTKEFGVASIPVSAFYQNRTDHKVIRFCFAKKQETLEQAAERLQKV